MNANERALRQGKTDAVTKRANEMLAGCEADLGDMGPVTGLSILEGMADAMPQSESRRAFREALETTRVNARRLLKGSRAGRAIFGDEDGQ
jgi:hypothetical protein